MEGNKKMEKEKKGKYIEPLKDIYKSLIINDDPLDEVYDLKKIGENDLLPREFYR